MIRDTYKQYCEDPDLLEEESDKALKITEGTVPRALHFQPEMYRHWAQLASIAATDAAKLKDHVKDVVWSDCFLRAIETLENSNQKTTEKKIEAIAKRDPSWQRHQSLLRDAEHLAATFRNIEQAMFQKKEVLQSLNSRQCRELSSLS